LDFFLATSGEEQISRVFLTGGTANLAQLAPAIERRSRVSAEVIQPLERIGVEGKEIDQQLLRQRAAQISVALGLAMRKTKEKRQGSASTCCRTQPNGGRPRRAKLGCSSSCSWWWCRSWRSSSSTRPRKTSWPRSMAR